MGLELLFRMRLYYTDGPKGECPFGRFQQTGQVCHAPWMKIVEVTRPR
jgi:hypothetical protein